MAPLINISKPVNKTQVRISGKIKFREKNNNALIKPISVPTAGKYTSVL